MDLLIYKAKKGDKESFIKLMELNKQAMYKTATAILRNDEDVADALQETILACYTNINKLKNSNYFKTWITKILINKCNDIVRKNKNVLYVDKVAEGSYCDDVTDDISLKESFHDLGENYNLLMTLCYIHQLSIKEISSMLGLNENTVKTRLSRGREHFKENYLKNEEGGFILEYGKSR
ncbi:MAG: sigma-70 family RNA polymerase sigma factor [Clostridium sp.]|uniref:RNA polymerase sigma factor n=1 Tax=Clostridium sp. TaxID=1506 RepID=UPI0030734673